MFANFLCDSSLNEPTYRNEALFTRHSERSNIPYHDWNNGEIRIAFHAMNNERQLHLDRVLSFVDFDREHFELT